MFQNIIIAIGLWLIRQSWFQLSVVKFVTKTIDGTGSKIDDRLLAFVKEHKRSIGCIAKKELNKANSVIDDRLIEAIKKA